MFTPGFKYFFGLAMGLATAAVVYGYTTGGDQFGPLVWGWKGGVGDHIGYIVLMGLAVTTGLIGSVLVAFRDADPDAQAHYSGVDTVVPTTHVSGTFWPVAGAFGAATAVVGLVLHPAIFVVGLALCGITAIEWTMYAWADRATGDPEANRALRNRVMAPLEIPVAGALTVGVVVLSASRILLNSTVDGAVFWAGAIAVVILGIGTLYATKPALNKNVIAGLMLLVGVAVVAGGIVAAVDGEREFHPHDVHEDDSHDDGHADE